MPRIRAYAVRHWHTFQSMLMPQAVRESQYACVGNKYFSVSQNYHYTQKYQGYPCYEYMCAC